MKKFLLLIIAVILIAGIFAFANNKSSTGNIIYDGNEVDLVLFHGKGCPHCAQFEEFLNKTLLTKYPSLHVQSYEVYNNQENRVLFEKMAKAYGVEIEGVPTIFIGDKVFVGYSKSIGEQIDLEIKNCLTIQCELKDKGSVIKITGVENSTSPPENPKKTTLKQKITIPAVIAAAFVDSINPCEFAILILLMSTVLASGNRKRALLAGIAFSLAIFSSYFLMGLGLYSVIQAVKITRTFFIVVAFLAIIIGLFNLKDYFWYGKWFKMEVPESWRPKMKMLVKGVTSIPGAFGVGILVSLFLLPCTSGPYIVILGMLAETATRNTSILYLLLYNLIFIIPMLAITLAIYFGLTTTQDAENWRMRKIRVLHLIAGIILIILGVAMLIGIWTGWF